jgi:hypothetical protein
VSELVAARNLDDAVTITLSDDPVRAGVERAHAHSARLAASGGGRVALIVPDGDAERARTLEGASTPGEAPGDGEDSAPVSVLSPRDAKGLEFDVAVVVEPGAIAQRPGDLYVALTRPTSVLDVVHALPLPPGMEGGAKS